LYASTEKTGWMDAITASNYSYLIDYDAVPLGHYATLRHCEGSRLKNSDMLLKRQEPLA
jgi:hypothetical protein